MSCIYPYFTKQGHTVPCGKCPVCLEKRTAQWVFRLQQEERKCMSSHFVTFTYSPEFLPKSPNGFSTLVRKDMQDFFKRLRKITGRGLKYYVVGEYGSQFKRPHYHAIIFNCLNPDLYQQVWGLKKNGVPFGNVFLGDVNGDSCGYVAGYVQKPRLQKMHANDDREPEFSNMSKGLGIDYLTPEMISYHKASFVTYMQANKRKLPLARYYKDKIFPDGLPEQLNLDLKEDMRKKEHARVVKYFEKHPDKTYNDYWEEKNERRRAAYKNMLYKKTLKL